MAELVADFDSRFVRAGDAEKVELWIYYFEQASLLIEETHTALALADPPPDLQSLHSRFVNATSSLAQATALTAVEVGRTSSYSEVDGVILVNLGPAALAWDETCQELSRAAIKTTAGRGFACLGLVPRMILSASETSAWSVTI